MAKFTLFERLTIIYLEDGKNIWPRLRPFPMYHTCKSLQALRRQLFETIARLCQLMGVLNTLYRMYKHACIDLETFFTLYTTACRPLHDKGVSQRYTSSQSINQSINQNLFNLQNFFKWPKLQSYLKATVSFFSFEERKR